MKPKSVVKVLFVLLVFNNKRLNACVLATKQIHDTFSFLCQNQLVKVDFDIYHLDRLNSSLKSEYFEKVFTSEGFTRKNDPILEIQPLNSSIFPAILDIVHGKEVYDVLNKDNYLSLLKELNHFGMRIDLQLFSSLIDHDLESCSPQDAKIIELYAFIIQNSQFEYLSKSVLKYLSNHLDVLQNHGILSFDVPLDHIVRLIKNLKDADENTRYRVVQICSKWLCHDMKNRLPHMAKLVKKTKLLHRDSEEMYSDFSKCLPSCDLDEEARQKMISTCFFAQVANGGKLHPTTTLDYNYDSYGRYSPQDSSDESETETIVHERYVNDRNDSGKLNEFRKNGYLYDITVRVGEKTYKLHRRILESKSNYFRDIFRAEYSEAIGQSDGTPKTCPSKDEEYLISDEIDPSTFDDVISSLYGYENLDAIFKRFEYKWDNIAKFLKIVHSLRLDQLLQDCIRNLKEEHCRANSQDVENILNFAHEKSEYENLYVIHLSKHLAENWPNIPNMSQFSSISLPVLKKVLNSPHFKFDDPHKILDICSKWTCHDVKDRYQFLPQIARVINPLCVVDDDQYTTEAVADFNISPENFVRDKLWKILSSLPYTIYEGKNVKNMSRERKLLEIPMFISVWQRENTSINVLNADLDVIASIINYSEPMNAIYSSWPSWGISPGWDCPTSATLIRDNLFILSSIGDRLKFLVYNFFLKTCTQLRCNLPRFAGRYCYHIYTLLNCNNEIYSCSIDGRIAKYSMEFDLWTILVKQDPQPFRTNLHYTSDRKTLYRMYRMPVKYRCSSYQYVVEEFDLRNSSWNRVTGSPLINLIPDPTLFSVINDRDFIIFAYKKIITSNRNVTGNEWQWSYREIPKKGLHFVQYKDRLLVSTDDKFYRYYPNNGSFEFKKAIPKALRYVDGGSFVAIDRH
ncbi:uncharacterized protein LOC135839028 isoform X1 [Planococcus citri]|uniref:uncharacterized protein LOC135839028 isoform X1 n=1 Tax=Planococcus citri TaxID=170843 RepID=UPI0031F9BD95